LQIIVGRRRIKLLEPVCNDAEAIESMTQREVGSLGAVGAKDG